MADRTVFVAGATGLVGTAVVSRLLADGAATRVRGSRHSDHSPSLDDPRVEYRTGDLQSVAFCREMARGCDAAILAAAYSGGAARVTGFPWEYVTENLRLNLAMLEALQLEGVRRVVFIGSATLYQDCDGVVREQDLDLNLDPHPAYMGFGWVARFTEKICRQVHDRTGVEMIVVRASNVFGPFARFDPATSNVVPALIRKAVARMDPFEVWGDPAVSRDVIYSADFADAIVALLDRAPAGFHVFNVGSSERTTVGQIVQWALAAAGHTPSDVVYRQDRPTTMRHRALDCEKVRKTVGWAPAHSIAEGIRLTTGWWTENQTWWTR